MKRSQQREVAQRSASIQDASPDTIAKYLQPAAPKHSPGAPVVDSLDRFTSAVRTSSRCGSRPGTASNNSIFASRPASARGDRVGCDSVFPDAKGGSTSWPDDGLVGATAPAGAGAPFGAPEPRAPAGRPRQPDTAGAAAEFAALGLGGAVGAGSFSNAKLGGVPGLPLQPSNSRLSSQPNYMAQMHAMPAAGARSGGAPGVFRNR